VTSTIAGVKVIAWAYTWSQTSIAYFNSTCGVQRSRISPSTKTTAKYSKEATLNRS